MIVHYHIRKCAGQTVNRVLDRVYGARHLQLPANEEAAQDAIPAIQSDGLDSMSSELGYGFANMLCDHRFEITLLRDPVDLVVSDYFHHLRTDKRHPEGSPAQELHERLVKDRVGLKGFLELELENEAPGSLLRRNRMVRYFGTSWHDKRPLIPADLEIAWDLLESRVLFGFVEGVADAVRWWSGMFGWGKIDRIPKANPGSHPMISRYSRTIRGYLESRLMLDVELYGRARRLWTERTELRNRQSRGSLASS